MNFAETDSILSVIFVSYKEVHKGALENLLDFFECLNDKYHTDFMATGSQEILISVNEAIKDSIV